MLGIAMVTMAAATYASQQLFPEKHRTSAAYAIIANIAKKCDGWFVASPCLIHKMLVVVVK